MVSCSETVKIKTELQDVLARHYCTYGDAEILLEEFRKEIVEQGKSHLIFSGTSRAANDDE